MGMWWFGRKSAPDTVRPYVPGWLTSGLYGSDAEEGFARFMTFELVADQEPPAAVETVPQDAPPATPAPGECHIVGTAPSGAWAGKAGQLACYGAGGWRFQPPVEGLCALVKSTGFSAQFRGGAWEFGVVRAGSVMIGGLEVLSTRSAAIPSPSGGSTVDSAARIAIDEVLAALRHHGLIDS